jgi:hypothetical protein
LFKAFVAGVANTIFSAKGTVADVSTWERVVRYTLACFDRVQWVIVGSRIVGDLREEPLLGVAARTGFTCS